jgi:hypothetical protein
MSRERFVLIVVKPGVGGSISWFCPQLVAVISAPLVPQAGQMPRKQKPPEGGSSIQA